MPDPGRRWVHCFRDHVVAGANWRPTRFVEEVWNSRVCGLCGIVPKQTVKMPCSHFLCQSCHETSSQGARGRCPLDQKPFEEAECTAINFPAKKANRLKVYCWNESQGCKFMGTVEDILRHFENECVFHAVECSRCCHKVLHKDLPAHYVAGCSNGVSAGSEYSSESTALTLEGLSTQEGEEAFSLNKHFAHLLSLIHTQIHQLTEHVMSQEAMLAEITRELRASQYNLRDNMVETIRTTISLSLQHLFPAQQNPMHDTRTSLTLPLRLEKALILRKLEHFANVSLSALERLRQNAPQRGRLPVIAYCEPTRPSRDRFRHLTVDQATPSPPSPELQGVSYFLTLENAQEIFLDQQECRTFAEVTVWHMRDTYFVLAVRKRLHERNLVLALDMEFNGLLEGSHCLPSAGWVTALHPDGWRSDMIDASRGPCSCKRRLDILQHFHRIFIKDIATLRNGFLRDGKMVFEIELLS
ncbi:hypothetical protein HPB49_013902 [Dermacentor silvarum]|uniref:Uncharacterized protein n=1 Tax=Dermacentor silvarum TaxID=543639 RepID=A0ACB8CRC4_DERSI|nr:uncharacterized protein LOC125945968 [Dermacentor silvarum]KAH7949686.1 hypothetical protein HPB49_013902 [Dermacentor silvarum]